MKQTNVKMLTFTAMMTAILCVLAPFSIPLGKVPISAATFIVYLAAILLGTKYGVICVTLYLLIGMAGVPVFAGWGSGLGVLAGPTGGYLIGYLLIALCTGLAVKLGKGRIILTFFGMLIGTIGCYVLGTAWMGMQLSLSPKAAMMAGVIPFIPGDLIKMTACLTITVPVRSQIKRLHTGLQ